TATRTCGDGQASRHGAVRVRNQERKASSIAPAGGNGKRHPPVEGVVSSTGELGGASRIRTGGQGFADPCLTTWPWRRDVTQWATSEGRVYHAHPNRRWVARHSPAGPERRKRHVPRTLPMERARLASPPRLPGDRRSGDRP